MDANRRRVVVAVAPMILQDALAHALAQAGEDVVSAPLADAGAECFAVAVVTADHADSVDAALVIHLPDETGSRPGFVTSHGRRHEVCIRGVETVLRLVRTGAVESVPD